MVPPPVDSVQVTLTAFPGCVLNVASGGVVNVADGFEALTNTLLDVQVVVRPDLSVIVWVQR